MQESIQYDTTYEMVLTGKAKQCIALGYTSRGENYKEKQRNNKNHTQMVDNAGKKTRGPSEGGACQGLRHFTKF